MKKQINVLLPLMAPQIVSHDEDILQTALKIPIQITSADMWWRDDKEESEYRNRVPK